MWETSLRLTFEDYELDEERKVILQEMVSILEDSLQPINPQSPVSYGAVEVPGTQEQSKSKLWFQARKYRITASKCKTVCLLGDKLLSGHAKQFKWRFFNWIQKNVWCPNFVQTNDMQYGINEEPKARLAYTQATGNQVQETGFWVNKKFPYLGASPDGNGK